MTHWNPKCFTLHFFDILGIEDPSKRLENLTALHLLKACHFWTDTAQGNFGLFFIRSKDGKEVDFLLTRDKRPWMLVECKSNSKAMNPTVARFRDQLKTQHNFHLVTAAPYHRYYKNENIQVCDYEAFPAQLI